MAKTTRRKSTINILKRKTTFSKKVWVTSGLAALCLICGYFWWFPFNNSKWTYLSTFGINLPLHYTVHGIDVSHHNATINWEKVKVASQEGVQVDFVYIKATEGATHKDRHFNNNWRQAKQVGIRRGAYHFYNPRVHSEKQAQNFIATVRLEPGDLPPVLDLETYAGKPDDIIIKGVGNWLRIIEEHYRVKPIIYINEHFYVKYIAGNFDDYPLWIAGYSKSHLNDLEGDPHVIFWQHSEKGRMPGIKGFVDFNAYMHDIDEWNQFLQENTYQ